MKRGAFETGTYRNVFAEAGYDKETIEKRKNEIFHTLFYGAESERIYHPVEDDMAYIEDTGNHDARTEGMSYGMMMCVLRGRRKCRIFCMVGAAGWNKKFFWRSTGW